MPAESPAVLGRADAVPVFELADIARIVDEVGVDVFFAREIRAPRCIAVRAVLISAEHARPGRVVGGSHPRMTGGRPPHDKWRVGGYAPPVFGVFNGEPALAVEAYFDDAKTVRIL